MPDAQRELNIASIGGLNVNDQPDQLIQRSHVVNDEGAFIQRNPTESPDLRNIDFSAKGWGQRSGSTEVESFVSDLVSGDSILAVTSFTGSGTTSSIAVGVKSIYKKEFGDQWVQMNDSAGAAYTHAADVGKCTFAELDGHLFIGLDGANQIQTYKLGDDLDAEMANGNTYEDAQGGGTNAITGTWDTGCYLVASFQGRLAFGKGDTLVNYTPLADTPSSGVWDMDGAKTGGYVFASGSVRAMTAFTPKGQDSEREVLYLGCDTGLEVVTTFDADIQKLKIEGTKSPLNQWSFVKAKTWLICLTVDGDLSAINGVNVIDIGRRLRNLDKNGPLDEMNYTGSLTTSHGFYDIEREQALWYISTGGSTFNNYCIVLDFQLGEPVPGQHQSQWEPTVRPLVHTMIVPETNEWFASVWQSRDGVKGVTRAGIEYLLNSGINDLGSLGISAYCKLPQFTGGRETAQKNWQELHMRGIVTGSWPVTVDIYIDREDSASDSFSFQQNNSGAVWDVAVWDVDSWARIGMVSGSTDPDRWATAFQWEVSNANASETFIITGMSVVYFIGVNER